MTAITSPRAPSAAPLGPDVVHTARLTGVFCLGLAITGLPVPTSGGGSS